MTNNLTNKAVLEFQHQCHDLTVTEILILEDIIDQAISQSIETERIKIKDLSNKKGKV